MRLSLNRIPASGKITSPHELFLRAVPDLSLIKVFECKAYVRREKADRFLLVS
jgi:hypothetical protein